MKPIPIVGSGNLYAPLFRYVVIHCGEKDISEQLAGCREREDLGNLRGPGDFNEGAGFIERLGLFEGRQRWTARVCATSVSLVSLYIRLFSYIDPDYVPLALLVVLAFEEAAIPSIAVLAGF